ncbi:PID-CTERM protein-sorting domain-containing protein [Aequorivita sp. CIP111184]|uniref:PID-CTERM protein-sorting domain-containing protein n=1 Tax=Aequorivita sp. CIP111184 TaxID=2211356 RepID=UPI000DBBDD8D|nr:hypothetical protein AEQU1_00432 [Aequorivita sp. CIP111184]
MSSLIYNVILLVFQATSGSQGPPPPSQNRAPGLPIDNDLWILLAAGILFGIYIIYKRTRVINKAA